MERVSFVFALGVMLWASSALAADWRCFTPDYANSAACAIQREADRQQLEERRQQMREQYERDQQRNLEQHYHYLEQQEQQRQQRRGQDCYFRTLDGRCY